jgi:hypothetical protein
LFLGGYGYMTNQFVDTISGHPMVFVPRGEVYLKPVRGIADLHHPVHPAAHPLLSGDAGKAIRECRGQMVDYKDHHIRYPHQAVEPRLPIDDTERMRYIGFNLAGYLDKGICFRSGSPRAVTLTYRHRERLRNSGELITPNPGAVRNFLVSRIMDQSISDGYEGLEQEFYDAEQLKKKRLLGHQIVAAKIRLSTADFTEDYQDARRAGLLDPAAPERPSKLIHDFMGDFILWDRIVDLMHHNGQDTQSVIDQQG